MADNDKLSFSWELKGTLGKQIKDAVDNAEKLTEALAEAVKAGEKIALDKQTQEGNIKKNLSEAEKAIYKFIEAKEKAERALSRNRTHQNEDLWGFDDTRLTKSVSTLNEIIDKIMNIGAAAAVSKNAVRNLLAETSADIVLKDVKGGTSDLNKQIDKKEKEELKNAKEIAKEIAKAQKDEEEAAARNAAAQQKVQDALARIATARSQLSAVSATASQQERMHVELLLSLLDRLSKKLASLKGTDLSAKGALSGVLGSGYAGLMRNVSTSIRNLENGSMTTKAEEKVEAILQMRQHKQQMDAAREEREYAEATREVNRALEEKAKKENEAKKAVLEHAQANQGMINAYNRVVEAGKNQSRLLTQLQQQMAGYFSLYAGEHFIKNLIQIGGEFEVQHIALQNILGDVQQANSMFEQMKELAVVSPFNFRQLASYSKQVAAFNIPYDEMFDTTKRLADISAGLGVDMGRLILAFGQVRSAAVLRGQELRQFTEAGIPLVQALADEFTRLNGRATSTAEVFELISKRAVPFEMVKKILWDMTEEGGRFYNTQFVLSDTLAGKWSNLQDAWEIMLSEIAEGESMSGRVLKFFVSTTTTLVENLSQILPLIAGIGLAYGTIKIKNWAGRFADQGFYGIDANIKKAQQLRAIELTRQKINGEITAQKYSQLMRMNAQKGNYYSLLAMEGKLNAIQLQRVYQKGKLNKEELAYLVLMGYITKEERKQIMLGQIQTGILARMSNYAKEFGKNLAGSIGKFGAAAIVIELATTALLTWMGHLEELKRKNEDLVNSFSNKGKGLADSLGNMTSIPSDKDGYKSAIDGMKEMLKEHSSNYAAIMREVDAIDTLEGKYKKLKQELDNTKKTYEDAQELAPEFANKTRGLFEGTKDAFRALDRGSGGTSVLIKNWAKIDESAEKIAEIVRKQIPNVGVDSLSTELYRQLRNSLEEEIGLSDKSRIRLNIKLDELLNITSGNEVSQLVLGKFVEAVESSEKAIANKIKYGQTLNKAEQEKVQELMNSAVKDIEKQYPYLRNTLQGLLNNSNFTATVRVMYQQGYSGNDLQNRVYGNFPMTYSNERVKLMATNWAGSNSAFDARNKAKSDIDQLYNEMVSRKAMYDKGKMTADEVKKSKDAYDEAVYAAMMGLGYDYEGEKKKSNKEKGNGSQSDPEAKRLREEIKLIKDAYSWYKKYDDELKWSSEDAFKEIEKKYGDTLKKLGISWDSEKGITEYVDTIKKKLAEAEKLYSQPKHKNSYMMDVIKELKDALTQSEFDEAKKQLQEYASLTQKTLSDMAQQWSTFKAVRDATGNRALASQMAGLTGVRAGFNNQAEDLRSDIGANVPGVDFGRVFNMSKKEIEEYAGTLDIPKDHIQGIIDKLIKWQELQRQVINADIQSFASLMGGLKDYDSEIQKINDRLEKQRESNQRLVGTTDENGRIITQAQADRANEIAETAAADEWWKKSSTYISLMNNSLALTKEQIGVGISQAQDILNEKLRVGLISAKEYADEMERLRGITDNFNKNSMFGVSNALTAYIQGGGSGLRTFLNTQMRNANTILNSPDATRKQKEQAMQQYNSAAGRIYELDKMDSLSKLSVGFDALAKTLDPVVKMFDALGMKDVSKVVGGVQGAISGAASGATAAAALGAGLGPYGAAIGAGISLLGTVGSELFGDEKERLEAEKARQETLKSIDANVEAIDYSIQKYMDKLNESYGAGALIAAEEARKQEQNRQKELAFGVQASNPDSGQWWYVFREAIANAIAGSGANVQNRWDMWTTEDPTELAKMLNWMRMNDRTTFAAMGIWGDDSHTQGKYLENLAESYDKMDEITKTLQERLSGISFEDLVSNFLDSLYEMANGAEDVFDDMEKNWKKMINKMIVNNIIGKELQEELKNFYENDFTKIYEDRKITQEERDSALASLEGIYNNYADKTKALSNLLYDISDESDSSMSSSIKGITEQTADLLASYINAIRADVSVSRQTLYQILQSMQRQSQMPVLAQAQLEELQTLVSLARDRNNWVSEIRDILHSSQNGSRPLRVN